MTTQNARQSTASIALPPNTTPAQFIQSGIQAVERIMRDVIKTDVQLLEEASTHILDAGGKRVRPLITLLAYATLGGKDIERIAPVAAAVELVHTASVVHDDINDHGVVRRGRPSINAIWGRTFALLTGDFLFTKVYELMAPFKDMNIILAEATVALVEGETLQASAVKENNFSREVYMKIIARKTAALFKSAAMLGGLMAGAAEQQVEALGHYGFNVGLAFQIVDDILDLIGDEAQLGKTSGIDVAQGRGFAVAHGNGHAAETADPMTAIKNKLFSGDTLTKGYTQAAQLAELANMYLDALPHSPFRDEMLTVSQQIVNRNR